jgi:AcrR family transcriptional regulator
MSRHIDHYSQAREESRERILGSALRLFGEHGFQATSVRMIAEEASVSQGLLYNYYEGKEALLRAIFERGAAQVGESFGAAVGVSEPAERLERLIRASFLMVQENLSFWRLSYQLRLQRGVLEGLGEVVSEWSESIRVQLEELLTAAGAAAPALKARLLFAAIDGVAQHYALDPAGYPIEEVVEALIGHFVSAA